MDCIKCSYPATVVLARGAHAPRVPPLRPGQNVTASTRALPGNATRAAIHSSGRPLVYRYFGETVAVGAGD